MNVKNKIDDCMLIKLESSTNRILEIIRENDLSTYEIEVLLGLVKNISKYESSLKSNLEDIEIYYRKENDEIIFGYKLKKKGLIGGDYNKGKALMKD